MAAPAHPKDGQGAIPVEVPLFMTLPKGYRPATAGRLVLLLDFQLAPADLLDPAPGSDRPKTAALASPTLLAACKSNLNLTALSTPKVNRRLAFWSARGVPRVLSQLVIFASNKNDSRGS